MNGLNGKVRLMRRRKPGHGERRRYNAGCRCAACTEANRSYGRRHRRGDVPSAGYIDRDELLAQCWCASDFVWIDKSVIRAGRTGSCGKDQCQQETAA